MGTPRTAAPRGERLGKRKDGIQLDEVLEEVDHAQLHVCGRKDVRGLGRRRADVDARWASPQEGAVERNNAAEALASTSNGAWGTSATAPRSWGSSPPPHGGGGWAASSSPGQRDGGGWSTSSTPAQRDGGGWGRGPARNPAAGRSARRRVARTRQRGEAAHYPAPSRAERGPGNWDAMDVPWWWRPPHPQ